MRNDSMNKKVLLSSVAMVAYLAATPAYAYDAGPGATDNGDPSSTAVGTGADANNNSSAIGAGSTADQSSDAQGFNAEATDNS